MNDEILFTRHYVQEQRDRVIAVDHCKAEQIALLTALSQVVSCTQEAIKILRESQVKAVYPTA